AKSSRAAATNRSEENSASPAPDFATVTGTSLSEGATFPPGKARKPPKKRSFSARRTMKRSDEPLASNTLAALAIWLTGKCSLQRKTRRQGGKETRRPEGLPAFLVSLSACLLVSLSSFIFGLWRRFFPLGRRFFPLGRRSQSFLDAIEEPLHGEWFTDVINNAQVLGVGLVAAPLVGRDHDDGRRVRL